MRQRLVALSTLFLGGCVTALPINSVVQVDPDTAPSCTRACETVGMRVGAIVFIRNMGGCVCEPKAMAAGTAERPAPEPRAASGSAAVAGGTVVVVLEEQRKREEEQQRRQNDASGVGHR